MNGNNILNIQESTTILNACTKKSGNLLKGTTYSYDLFHNFNDSRVNFLFSIYRSIFKFHIKLVI